MAKERWLKSGRVKFSSSNIDHESGVISDVIMCQVGEAKGHKMWLEQEFIDDVVAYASKHHARIGMKARFGHPSMSNETLGTEMGRFKNFRVDGEKAIADLHLLDAANDSPTHPGMKDWMLNMAKEDPNAIMCSIVFVPDHYYQYDENGKRYKIEQRFDSALPYWASLDKKKKYNPNAKIYVALKEVHFCDIVDQGAATDKLFSVELNKDKFAVIATEFLNEYPQIDEFIQENPEKIIEFINNRKSEFEIKPDLKMKLSKAWSSFLDYFKVNKDTPDEDMPELNSESLEMLHAEHAKVIGERDQLNTEKGDLQKEFDQMKIEKEKLESEKKELETSRNEWKGKYEKAYGEDEADKTGNDKIDPPTNEKKFEDYEHNKEALDVVDKIS